MTNQENEKLLKTFIDETWNKQNTDKLNEYLADDYVEHTPFGDFHGLDEFRGFITMNLRGFPDFEVKVENVVVTDNMVACTYISSGTQKEEYLGIEATGNHAEVDGCYVARVENGKIVEGWNQFDTLAMLTALEVISPDMLGDIQEGAGRQVQTGTRQ